MQATGLSSSAALLCFEPEKLKATIGETDGKLLFIVYEEDKGHRDPFIADDAERDCLQIVRASKDEKLWILALQVLCFGEDTAELEKATLMFVNNIPEDKDLPSVKGSPIDTWLMDMK